MRRILSRCSLLCIWFQCLVYYIVIFSYRPVFVHCHVSVCIMYIIYVNLNKEKRKLKKREKKEGFPMTHCIYPAKTQINLTILLSHLCLLEQIWDTRSLITCTIRPGGCIAGSRVDAITMYGLSVKKSQTLEKSGKWRLHPGKTKVSMGVW